jgi:asparagine synthase (glutamine-hydrolysing)
MCGIAGFLDASATGSPERSKAVAIRMVRTLAHRGPDDEGAWIDPEAGVALAHRRLAIVDLSADGHQPMVSADGRWVLTYNGEIYNHRELRTELEARQHRFRGQSDTEVLLAAVCEWGLAGALGRCNGMFAAALWDRDERRLHLCRDRLGEKPLYYGWDRRLFLFASELRAIRAHPEFRCELDRSAIALFLRHGYVGAPRCAYRGLEKLVPGTIASVDPRRPGDVTLAAYWSARGAVERGKGRRFQGTAEDAVSELHRLLVDSVRLRMVADVPVGAFLSGGVDSSTVVALAQAHGHAPARTFSVGFPFEAYDEATHARRVAAHLGTAHTELYVTGADAAAVVPEMARLYDEPFADASQIPTYLVARLARTAVTVGLSGDGGDELFAGYSRYDIAARLWRSIGWVPHGLRSALARIVAATPAIAARSAVRLLGRGHRIRRTDAEVLRAVANLLVSRDSLSLYRAIMSGGGDPDPWDLGPLDSAPVPRGDDLPECLDAFVERMMFWDTTTYLPDDILTKVDRATMGVGLEARVPFLDHRVFEFAWSLPAELKVRDGVAKWPVRQVLDRYVPRALVDRPKAGFGVPLAAWLRGPLRAWAEDLLAAGALRRQDVLEPALVRRMLDEHLSGARDWHNRLWPALSLAAWLAEAGRVSAGAPPSS